MSNGTPDRQRLVNDALKSLDKVDEQLNLARENISRASYHNRKARTAIQGLGGLPTIAFSLTGFALVAIAGWSGFHGFNSGERLPDAAHSAVQTGESYGSGNVATTQFVGSKESGLFHRMDCADTQKIGEDSRTTYSSADAARAAGLKFCPKCEKKH